MEMERPRRSLDRIRDVGIKKPRLSEDTERDRATGSNNAVVPARERALPPRSQLTGGAPSTEGQLLDPRIGRVPERARDPREDSARGGGAGGGAASGGSGPGYFQKQQQQLQELVAQYKTALAELTFNSKPIITNLTIIAGENLHAAKAIAATVCAHILEVPRDQKLPSLYLLDSIVKNIGQDYIRYFAGRLPEVFCKAYRHVDASVHPALKHLFGTWRGVFPHAPLQLIEKDLFSPSTDRPSSEVTSLQSDSQSQRPPHSIHVNPKYLEARQRLQQSSRGTTSGKVDGLIKTEGSDGRAVKPSSSVTDNSRPRVDTPIGTQNISRPVQECLGDPSQKKKSILVDQDDDLKPDVSQYMERKLGSEKKFVTERAGLDRQWHGTDRGTLEPSFGSKNGYGLPLSHEKYKTSVVSQAVDRQPPLNHSSVLKNNQLSSGSWKNSEEEEFMWDDMNTKLTEQGMNGSLVGGSLVADDIENKASIGRSRFIDASWNRHEKFYDMENAYEAERGRPLREYDGNLHQAHIRQGVAPIAGREAPLGSSFLGGSQLGNKNMLVQPHEELHTLVGPSHQSTMSHNASHYESSQATRLPISTSSSVPRPHLRLPVADLPSTSISTKSHVETSQAARSSQAYFQTSSNLDHLLPQLNHLRSSKVTPDSLFARPQAEGQVPMVSSSSHPSATPSTHNPDSSSLPVVSLGEWHNRLSLLQQLHPDKLIPKAEIRSEQISEEANGSLTSSLPSQLQGIPSTDNSNKALSGLQSHAVDLLNSIMKDGMLPGIRPGSLPASNAQPPPLPSGPPPVQTAGPSITPPSQLASMPSVNIALPVGNTAAALMPPLPPGPPPSSLTKQASSPSVSEVNPLSSLLNSLVARGLIHSEASEKKSTDVMQGPPGDVPSEVETHSTDTSEHAMSALDVSTAAPSAAVVPGLESPKSMNTSLSNTEQQHLQNLIGIEFKPEVIRSFHPIIIDSLFGDLKHRCRICGSRFRHPEVLSVHEQSHSPEKSGRECSNHKPRTWFVHSDDWIIGYLEEPSCKLDGKGSDSEPSEPMVPADESQSICGLCGEPFFDVYCHAKDEWMYKGTVFLMCKVENTKASAPGLIVHAKCMDGIHSTDL